MKYIRIDVDLFLTIVYNKNMLLSTKIRLYPNDIQTEKLAKSFGCIRWFWNNSLAESQRLYQETGRGLGRFDMNNRLPTLKKEFKWLAEVHSQVLQSVSLHLSRAFINFFEKRAEYPKFKTKRAKQSIQYPQGVKIVDGNKLFLPKIGQVEAVIHREIVGIIKTVTISKTPTGKYFAAILTENDLIRPMVSYDGKILGITAGLSHFATTSEGLKIDNSKHIVKVQKNLRRKQKKLLCKLKGSNNRNKARLLVMKAHEKIANVRKDYLHKLSKQLVDENQVIAVKHLSLGDMTKNLNPVSNEGWGVFREMLKYKAERVGKGYIEVNPFLPSPRICSCCGIIIKDLPLNMYSWICENCNASQDSDVNSAKNISLGAKRMITVEISGTAI